MAKKAIDSGTQGRTNHVLKMHIDLTVGLYRILILPDIRPPDIWPIILPDTGYPALSDTGYPAGYPAK